jgi:hypothetical protein
VGRVNKDKVANQAIQGIAELHGVPGSNRDRVIIQAEVGIIDNGTRGFGRVGGRSPSD